MRIFSLIAVCFLAVLFADPGRAADVNAGISIGDEGLKGFYLAIGEQYQAPEREVVAVRQWQIPDEEIPVVFFLARRANVGPEVVIKMRLGGKSWMDIAIGYGLTAEVFYVPVTVVPGPPYGKAYGHFRNHDRSKWGTIRLADADIINFVNLKFISERYHCPADDVIKMREKGANFVSINTEVKQNKEKAKHQAAKQADQSNSDQKGKGKGKKK
jgi:hypothetical protein